MILARGVAALGAVAFVRERFGAGAHDRVLAALPARHAGTFRAPLTDASWRPLADIAAYAETARRLYAPDEPDFYFELGKATGSHERERGGFKPMVAEPSTAMRMGRLVWMSLYDSGDLAVEIRGPREGCVRISGFDAGPEFCQAARGALVGLAGSPESPAVVRETACIHSGAPACEFHILWP